MAKKLYDNLTNGLMAWAERHTDLSDWGYLTPRDGVKSANTNRQYERSVNRLGWPPQLTKSLIQGHLARKDGHLVRTDTIYYRSAGWALVQPLMIDVDAHEGEDDALDLAMFILSFFPGSYMEPSTNDKGFHIYAHIALGTVQRDLWETLVGLLERALMALRAENSFKAKVELKGLATTTKRTAHPVYRYAVDKRGSLAKLPRLAKGEQDLIALQASPEFDLARVRAALAAAPPTHNLPECWDHLIIDHYGTWNHVPQPLAEHRGGETEATEAATRYNGCVGDFHQGHANAAATEEAGPPTNKNKGCVGDLASHPDAWHRMLQACMILARSLGRLPSVEELVQFYESEGLHTGEDVGNRRLKRAAKAIEYIGKSFDPVAAKQGFTDSSPSLLAAIQQHVKTEHQATGFRWKITDQDLMVVLYLVVKGSFAGRFDCSNASIEQMFKKLKAEGVIKRSCDRHKAIACKDILMRAGLIVCVNRGYKVGVRGKQYAIGPNHPRYGEFTAWFNQRQSEPNAQ